MGIYETFQKEIKRGCYGFVHSNTKTLNQVRNSGKLLQATLYACNNLFINCSLFDLASTCFTHCRKIFKKFVFLASPKTRVVTGVMDRVALKLKQDLAPMDEGNGEKQVKSRSMNQYDHVMI